MDSLPVSMLVDAQSLLRCFDNSSVRVIDCWRPESYKRAHIPGAVHITHDYWLKQPAADGGTRGAFLLEDKELASLFGSLGVSGEHHVVLYDDNGGRAAARVWWILRYLGHQRVSVLNGGWHAWLDADGPVSYSPPDIEQAEFPMHIQPSRLATYDDVLQAIGSDVQLLDTRSAAEWAGTDFHGNRRAGHIPSAKHLEWNRLITEERPWMFRAPEEILATAQSAGVDPEQPVLTYCQGGVRAAHVAFALELAGFAGVGVYDASMQEWANRSDTELDR